MVCASRHDSAGFGDWYLALFGRPTCKVLSQVIIDLKDSVINQLLPIAIGTLIHPPFQDRGIKLRLKVLWIAMILFHRDFLILIFGKFAKFHIIVFEIPFQLHNGFLMQTIVAKLVSIVFNQLRYVDSRFFLLILILLNKLLDFWDIRLQSNFGLLFYNYWKIWLILYKYQIGICDIQTVT